MNRFYWPTKYDSRAAFLLNGVKCVFISYQQDDKAAAIKVADYLIASGIDVYIDMYDAELKPQAQGNRPKEVTQLILKGINNSSHMLAIVSPSTIQSKWVPFEIGYGYEKTDLSVLCLKGIPKGSLPEYIRTAHIIRDIYDFNIFIPKLTGQNQEYMVQNRLILKENDYVNPLRDVMDTLTNDQY